MMRQSSLDAPAGPKPNIVQTVTYEHHVTAVCHRMFSHFIEHWGDDHRITLNSPLMDGVQWILDNTKGGHEISFVEHYEEFLDLVTIRIQTGNHVVTFAFERQEDAALFRMFWS